MMRARIFLLAAVLARAAAAWQEAPPAFTVNGLSISSFAVGHQYRQDDWPALATAPDGSLWLAWLSFNGTYDDVAIRHFQNGAWSNIHWVPNTSGDNWLPQIAVDAANRPWVVWSQQKNGNWDLYARRFDPARQEWGGLVRLTTDPLPDINPRVASNAQGRFALVWQGWRGRNSNIFLKTFDGQTWSPEVRVTNRPANDWEPAVALDSQGAAWVVYDSYKNGNYDVFLSRVQGGRADPEIPVAVTPLFEARATVAVDAADRVWVAWEEGLANWGKDQGYILRDRPAGAFLGGVRHARIRCYRNGQWLDPAMPLGSVFAGDRVSQPHVFASPAGLWVAAKIRHTILAAKKNPPGYYFPTPQKGYWEYQVTRLDGSRWTEAFALPASKGRSSTRVSAAWDASGNLWMAWPTDGRLEGDYHRPIRQQIFAAKIEGAAPGAPPALQPAVPPEVAASKPAHGDEPGDLRAIRSYTVTIGGRPHHIFRGDFHRHTELSWDRGGEPDGSLQDFYRYMIDAAAMDFGASTDHQGGAWPYWWWYTEKMTDMYHVPGAYVPIFGYERSAQYPFGHRNIFFAKRTDARVTPFFLKEGVRQYALPVGPEGDEPGSGTPDLVKNDSLLLYEEIRAHNGLAIRHTTSTNQGGLWNENDPNLEPVVEIFQGARTSSEQAGGPLVTDPAKDTEQMNLIGYRPEGMISVAWAKGYKLGVIASSDHFSTHISYAMVYTADPTRQGILDAIRKRHTYGATDNIILDVRMGEHFMGDEFQLARAEPMRVKARGTRPIVRVEVLKDGKVIYATAPGRNDVSFEFDDAGGVAGRHYYYVRLQQDDRMTAWSSPFFVNYR
ncbi:MAG TPA: hypothetical protein VFA33_09155 [Bryobacteraceae bacterium]|nr:hypothetical protein [Bryobacteraceae bacterium]